AIILLYYALFYPSQLIDRIILLTGALISTNLASRRGVGGKFYMIIALILLFYFIYNFITTLTILPIIGTSLSFLLLLLSNRSKRLPYISYITFPLGISIIMYSFSSINPLVINFVQLIFGVLLILITLIPITRRKIINKNIINKKGINKLVNKGNVKNSNKFKAKLCKNINKSDCKNAIELYKNFMAYIPQNCLDKIVLCTITQNDMYTFNLLASNPTNSTILEKYINKMTPQMLYVLALSPSMSNKKKSLLELACRQGFRKACDELGPVLDIANWDPKNWIGREIYGYKVIDIIGTGGTSYILKGEKDGKLYALKIPLTKYLSNIVELIGESSKLIELSNKSPYIVRLYAMYTDQLDIESILKGKAEVYLNKPPLIVTELMEGGSIIDIDKNMYNSEYWKKIVFLIVAKIAEALEIIHAEGYVHCDIKPQNILLSKKLTYLDYESLKTNKVMVKLADLGSAVRAGQKPFSYTPAYAPFDLVKASIYGGVSPTVDIYSLGASLYRVITGTPLNSNEMIEAMLKFEEKRDPNYLNYSLYNTRNIFLLTQYIRDKEIYNFITKMIDPEPNNRPTSREVKEFFYSKI
ncbi:MAG: serine/threonine-protein kinase, partial [Saccharolobus sp.]